MFIPLLHSSISFFSKFIPLHTCSSFHKFIFENIDYNYTNIIGSKEKCRPNVTNARFLTTTIKEEICFNIISFDNVINIICTFKNGVVKDKKKLEESIYKAYNVLLGNSICFACPCGRGLTGAVAPCNSICFACPCGRGLKGVVRLKQE
jgi:hypothetical protein